jgi:protein-tyrosine-phosphatase
MRSEARRAPPLIVFVCEHGSAKSLVSASFCQRLAQDRGLAVKAVSRGTAPDAAVPAAVVAALHEDGFDVASFVPRAVSDGDLRAATCVVAFGVDLRERVGADDHLERWDDIPPVSRSYAEAREAILLRLEALLRRLESVSHE